MPRLSILDYAHRATVWSCVGLTVYGIALTTHGFVTRMQNRQDIIPLDSIAAAIDNRNNPESPFQPDQPQQSQNPS